MFTAQRVYDYRPAAGQAAIFINRLYPRGVTKEKFATVEWLKDIAPSAELCRWYHEDSAQHSAVFTTCYHEGLQGGTRQKAVAHLLELEERHGAVLILTVVKNPQQSHVSVLAQYLGIPFVYQQAV